MPIFILFEFILISIGDAYLPSEIFNSASLGDCFAEFNKFFIWDDKLSSPTTSTYRSKNWYALSLSIDIDISIIFKSNCSSFISKFCTCSNTSIDFSNSFCAIYSSACCIFSSICFDFIIGANTAL